MSKAVSAKTNVPASETPDSSLVPCPYGQFLLLIHSNGSWNMPVVVKNWSVPHYFERVHRKHEQRFKASKASV